MTSAWAGLSHGRRQALLVSACLLAVVAVFRWVDLVPRVETDFFFSPEDPQLQASEEIGRRFPSAPQIIVRAEGGAVIG